MAELLFNFSATCLRRLVCVCIPFIRLKAVGNTNLVYDTENLRLLCSAVYGAVGIADVGVVLSCTVGFAALGTVVATGLLSER